MLSVAGIKGTDESAFLVRTLAAALLSLTPPLYAIVVAGAKPDIKWYVILGLAMYMILSSLVDLYGYIVNVVNFNSIPSIAFRVILGIILMSTNQKRIE